MRRRSRCEALMAVPPGPAQPGSAPVFGRYAGLQGVQGWQRGKCQQSSAEPCFHGRTKMAVFVYWCSFSYGSVTTTLN